MFYEAEIPAFFNDFAINVVADPDNNPTTIKAIFNNDYLADDMGFTTDLATRKPMILVSSKDADDFLLPGTIVDINGTRYTTLEPEPDGTGMTEIRLHKA